MSATTQINMINLQVFAEQQAGLDKQKGTYDADLPPGTSLGLM